MRFIVLLGIVSLFSDMTYEGARSLTAQYLQILGASSAAVGFMSGLSEILGNGIRLLSGYAIDKTKGHWAFMFVGYALNLFTVPLLAFVTSWKIAVILVLLERLGKGIRTPARDVLIFYASKNVGRGWAFGLHEAMDQIGAVVGPTLISTVFYFKGSYKESFLVLAIPAICAMSVLVAAKQLYPQPIQFEVVSKSDNPSREFPKIFWLYLLFISLTLFGIMPFQLSAYHFKATKIISDNNIPLLFAFAMLVDAISALVVGKLYDKYRTFVLILIPFFSLPTTFMLLSCNVTLIFFGMVFWGVAVALEESIMRAYIGDIVSVEKRALSYGIFNAVVGIVKFIRNTLMGFFYYKGLSGVIIIGSITLQIIAIWLFLFILSRKRQNL